MMPTAESECLLTGLILNKLKLNYSDVAAQGRTG